MDNNNEISRSKFLQQIAMLGVASIVSPFASAAVRVRGSAKKVRVGLIGCGSVSTQYLPHLFKSEYADLVSTCDIIPERALKAAEQYKISNHYPSIEKMLMVNLTGMPEHGRLNKIALLAAKHVWSEKPMATNYEEGKSTHVDSFYAGLGYIRQLGKRRHGGISFQLLYNFLYEREDNSPYYSPP